MKYQWNTYAYITWRLLQRDFFVLKSNFVGILIDSAVALGTELILIVNLLPLMGMPQPLIAPLFVGTIFSRLFSLGHNNAIRSLYALEQGGLPLYEALLPLPKQWLFARNLIRFTMENFLILCPVVIIALLFFGKTIGFSNANWPLLSFFIVTSSLFFGALSIFLAHHYSLSWYLENGWARRLSVMWMTSVILITWKTTLAVVPWFAYITLFNPTTYMIEGMRGTLLDPQAYLPLWIAVLGTLVWCVITILAMNRSITKRLDLV